MILRYITILPSHFLAILGEYHNISTLDHVEKIGQVEDQGGQQMVTS